MRIFATCQNKSLIWCRLAWCKHCYRNERDKNMPKKVLLATDAESGHEAILDKITQDSQDMGLYNADEATEPKP